MVVGDGRAESVVVEGRGVDAWIGEEKRYDERVSVGSCVAERVVKVVGGIDTRMGEESGHGFCVSVSGGIPDCGV